MVGFSVRQLLEMADNQNRPVLIMLGGGCATLWRWTCWHTVHISTGDEISPQISLTQDGILLGAHKLRARRTVCKSVFFF
jgi:hypothetical protein